MVKSRKWKVFYPGEIYAWDFEYKVPVSKKEVLEDLREREKVKRLPAGVYVEPGSTVDWYKRLSPKDKAEQDFIFRTR
jgi:hypothetical protein